MSELLKINVNEHTEKKNGLTYLSWAWAWAEVLKIDPAATWDVTNREDNGLPYIEFPDGSAMVQVAVKIKENIKGCMLPVMNHRNQAIKNPDAFAVNTAIMRCLAKAIAMHGLGLYIYAGEDLPEGDNGETSPEGDLAPALKESIQRIEQEKQKRAGVMSATLPAVEASLDTNTRVALNKLAEKVTKIHATGAFTSMYHAVEEQGLTSDEKLYLWSLLESGVRSRLKREHVEATMRETVERNKETT